MPPEYRPPPNAHTVYFYKDGTLMPDPELSGEEQIAQQAAYIACFARFEEDAVEVDKGEDDQEDALLSDDGKLIDMFDENGDMRNMMEDEIEAYESPAEEKPNEIMAELLREEKRAYKATAWLAISNDLDVVLSSKYDTHFIAASRLDIGCQLEEMQEIDPNNHKDNVPSLTQFDFPRYWNYTLGILSKEDPEPKPSLYPLQGDWKIIFKDQKAGNRVDAHYARGRTYTTTIDLPTMFKLHNEDLQMILKRWDLLPEEGLRDGSGNLLVLEPTAEDAQNLAEILLMDSMTGGWVATSSLLSRIQKVHMACGPPPSRELPVPGQPDLLVVEDDLDALVKLYHYYRDQAEPKLRAMRFVSRRMPRTNEKKEIASLVERVICMRNAVQAAESTAAGVELKPKKDRTAKEREGIPRKHPISPWFQDPVGKKVGSDRMQVIPWPDQTTDGQPKITDWTCPDAGDRYTIASFQRTQRQLNDLEYTMLGKLKPQDAFDD